MGVSSRNSAIFAVTHSRWTAYQARRVCCTRLLTFAVNKVAGPSQILDHENLQGVDEEQAERKGAAQLLINISAYSPLSFGLPRGSATYKQFVCSWLIGSYGRIKILLRDMGDTVEHGRRFPACQVSVVQVVRIGQLHCATSRQS